MFGEEVAIGDARGYGRANAIPELAVENGVTPLDYRLHASRDFIDDFFEPLPDDVAPEGAWYKAGDLLVRRTLEVDYASAMDEVLRQKGITVDFSNTQTLFPYHERNAVLGPIPL